MHLYLARHYVNINWMIQKKYLAQYVAFTNIICYVSIKTVYNIDLDYLQSPFMIVLNVCSICFEVRITQHYIFLTEFIRLFFSPEH